MKAQEQNWKPTPEQLAELEFAIADYREDGCNYIADRLQEIYDHIKEL